MLSYKVVFVIEYNLFQQIDLRAKLDIDRICKENADFIISAAKLAIMNPPKTGRLYKRGKKFHQASAPGEAPATDYGNLVGDSEVLQRAKCDYMVCFNAEYAAALEFGSPSRNLLPRPFLVPAAERYRESFKQDIEKYLATMPGARR